MSVSAYVNVSYLLRFRRFETLELIPVFDPIPASADVCDMTDYISFSSNGYFFGKKKRILCFHHYQLTERRRCKSKTIILVNAVSTLGQKCLVIWKVNHPAHLIS